MATKSNKKKIYMLKIFLQKNINLKKLNQKKVKVASKG